jgi:RNA polymerase sigma-70 factor (ECF subfamily)
MTWLTRFTTWAYKFVVLEVSSKLGRHFWQRPAISLDAADWERLPDRFGISPADHAERRALIAAVRRAVQDELTERQRRVFIAIVVDGNPAGCAGCAAGFESQRRLQDNVRQAPARRPPRSGRL